MAVQIEGHLDIFPDTTSYDFSAGGNVDELKRLKQDYLELDRIHHEEKELLTRILQTFGTCVSADPEILGHVESLKRKIKPDLPLDQEFLEEELDRMKSRILFLEEEPSPTGDTQDTIPDLSKDDLQEACQCLKRIIISLLEDFYPVHPDLEKQAQGIDLDCAGDLENLNIQETSASLLDYINSLKDNIAVDFRELRNTLFTLLDYFKELEKTFADEFGGTDGRIKEIEYFEMKVNNEVGSIVQSFDIHTTVKEIKQAVVQKINNIRDILSNRKKEEMSRAERFQKNIESLKQRINEVEKDAQEMTQKAEEFEMAATMDELTGLFNRKAFDDRLMHSLDTFHKGGSPFALILFDVDKFKEINDTLGHVAGDKVLQKVADCLKQTFRKHDFIARYGGDEFVVLIDELSTEMAKDKILTFMKHLKLLHFTSHSRGDITVTVSPGIAIAREGDTADEILDRADQAMYETKKRRR
jgi:diguanylate cyclase